MKLVTRAFNDGVSDSLVPSVAVAFALVLEADEDELLELSALPQERAWTMDGSTGAAAARRLRGLPTLPSLLPSPLSAHGDLFVSPVWTVRTARCARPTSVQTEA
mmetsp:Transcript_101243/g.325327  ORF Transcript_101243/g.325327 Transcript_101243/m.325327 type:complete len:105 (+) Transcript_101243:2260-2574(+)